MVLLDCHLLLIFCIDSNEFVIKHTLIVDEIVQIYKYICKMDSTIILLKTDRNYLYLQQSLCNKYEWLLQV